MDNEAIHQRITQFLAEQQRREINSQNAIEQRLTQLRHEFQDAITERATSFTGVSQEFRGRGARHEQLHQLVHNNLMGQMLTTRLDRMEAWMTEAGRDSDRFSNDTCASIRSTVNEQKEQREMIRSLAQQIEALRNGTHPGAASSAHNAVSEPTPVENSPPVMMELEIEQVDQNSGEIGNLRHALRRLDLIEDQIQRWRHRLPDLMLGDHLDEITTAIELQDGFQAFKVADWGRIEEIRDVITAIDSLKKG